jgi:hypothetical protein
MTGRLALPNLSPRSRKKARNEKKRVHLLVSPLTLYDFRLTVVKLPAHRAGLPEEEVSLILCPLTPPPKRGVRGTFRPKTGGTRRWKFRLETRRLTSEPRLIIEEESKKFTFLITKGNGLCFFFTQRISPLSDRLRWRQLLSNILPSGNSVQRC